MQIVPLNTAISVASGGSTSGQVDAAGKAQDGDNALPTQAAPAAGAAQPLRRGLSNWDHPLQGEISGAQQALEFLEQSASQLQSLKNELSAKLGALRLRQGQVEARVRQFSNTWSQRQKSSGGTLDAQLGFSSKQPASQRFSVRGLNLANLQSGGKEMLAISVGGANQALRSVSIEPGLSDADIVQRFNLALAPAKVSVSAGDDGALLFSTPESNFALVRDTLAIKGGGLRFPTGQLNRVSADGEPPAIDPQGWKTDDIDSLRQTLQQVVQALGQVQQARETVKRELQEASSRVASAQLADSGVSMDRLAQNFVSTANEAGYRSLLSLTSAVAGISRERVQSLLGLR